MELNNSIAMLLNGARVRRSIMLASIILTRSDGLLVLVMDFVFRLFQ